MRLWLVSTVCGYSAVLCVALLPVTRCVLRTVFFFIPNSALFPPPIVFKPLSPYSPPLALSPPFPSDGTPPTGFLVRLIAHGFGEKMALLPNLFYIKRRLEKGEEGLGVLTAGT